MSTTQVSESEEPRALRADARRNRERLLAVAADAFAEHGFDIGVAEIAKRAGVGTGTLFRHFPTKLDLEVAVVLANGDQMRELVAEALAEPDPWAAFELAMTRSIELMAHDRCIAEVASPELLADPRMRQLRDEVVAGFDELLRRGQDAGAIRADVESGDLPVLTTAVAAIVERYGQAAPDLWRRYLGIVLDGLRATSTTPLSPAAPSLDALDRAAGCFKEPGAPLRRARPSGPAPARRPPA